MIGKLIWVLVALLSSYALGQDNADVPYVFTDNDLFVLRRIPQTQVNGMGKKIGETPIIVAFANLRHLSHDQLSTSLLQYSRQKLQEGNMDDAFSVVGYFVRSETVLEANYRGILIYKHALSTISPAKEIPIKLNCSETEEICHPEIEL